MLPEEMRRVMDMLREIEAPSTAEQRALLVELEVLNEVVPKDLMKDILNEIRLRQPPGPAIPKTHCIACGQKLP